MKNFTPLKSYHFSYIACYPFLMARQARTVIPGVAHHVTQRGNYRQDVFFTDDDRRVYLSFLR